MKFLNDLTIQQIVARGVAGLLLAALLGGMIAFAASIGRGGRRDWRRILDPSGHVSIPGLVMLILFRQGWLRLPSPMPSGRRAWLAGLAALAGPVLLVWLVALIRPQIAGWGLGPWGRFGLSLAQETQLLAAGIWVFSLIPLPPLAGACFLAAAAPRIHARVARWSGAVTVLLVLALVAGWIPALGRYVLPWMLKSGGMG